MANGKGDGELRFEFLIPGRLRVFVSISPKTMVECAKLLVYALIVIHSGYTL